jgi:hypothetical protein
MPPKSVKKTPEPAPASAEEKKAYPDATLTSSSRPKRFSATASRASATAAAAAAAASPAATESGSDDEPKATKLHIRSFTSKKSPRGASQSASVRGGEEAEDWQIHDWEKTYGDDVPSPDSPSIDPKKISAEAKRWFSEDYLDIFISHFRRNTEIARSKHPEWLERIRRGNKPFAGHPINLQAIPRPEDPDMKYFGYFNYKEYPGLGVSDDEMKTLNVKRGRPPRIVILIGGASVGKSSVKLNFVENASDLDVDEPVMYADAMFQQMPDKEKIWGKGKGIDQRHIIYAVVDRLIRNGDDIIIDTTGGSKMAIHYAMNKAKMAGYQIVCVAVWSQLDVASERCDRRTATTLRTMNGKGVYFTFKGAHEGRLIDHYALKPRFRNKTDLFFLIDNTEMPTREMVSAAEAATKGNRSILGDISIPPTTVLILKNTHEGELQTNLVYKTPRSRDDIQRIDFYGCHVHLPTHISPEQAIDPSVIIRCSQPPPPSAKKGGRRTRKIIKIRKTNRRIYKSNNRSSKHTRYTRHYPH